MEDKTRYVLYVVILGLVLSGLGSIFSETLAADLANRVPIATFFLVCICLFLILFNYESSKTPDQLEQTLTKRVSDSWVADLVQFKKHLPHGSLFPVRFSFCADGVRVPCRLRSVSSNAGAEPTISTAFQMSGGSLLVLGEAGSGKTVSLLQLTGELIENAKKDPSAPIPIFLSLASWKSESLEAWLMTELRKRYDVAEDVSRSWILGKRLVFLLDDLKEPDDTHIEAINGFLTAVGTQGIVFSAEEVRSSVKLNLNGAIRLQQLSEGLTRQFLGQLHTEQTATDEIVRISRSPLILAIISFAPHAMFEFLRGCGKSLPAKKDVVNAYVNHQIEKIVPKLNPPYASSKLRKWLSWLATTSSSLSHNMFAIDDLQPNWLIKPWHINVYVFLSRFAGALTVMALGVGLMKFSETMGHLVRSDAYSFHFINVHASLNSWFLITVIIGGVTIGLVDYFRLIVWPASRFSSRMTKLSSSRSHLLPRSFVWSDLIVYFSVFWIVARTLGFDLNTATHGAAAYGVAFAVTYWNRARDRTFDTDINTSHKLVWAPARIPEGLLGGLIAGCCVGILFILYEVISTSRARLILAGPSIIAFIVGLAFFRPKHANDPGGRAFINSGFEAGVVWGTVIGIVNVLLILGFYVAERQGALIEVQTATRGLKILGLFGLLGTIVGLIVRGLNKVSIVEERTRHQGLKTSLRTTILLWLSVGVPIVLLLWGYTTRVMGKQGTFKESLFFGMMLGMLFGFSYGGLDLIYRAVLRTILRVRGDVPFFYSTILDDAANVGILRRVGHAYVFYHDLVRDYFNTHARSVPQVATSDVKTQHPYLDVSQEGDFSGSAS